MSVIKIERLNRYDEFIEVNENLRSYTNPLGDSIYPIPSEANEILVQNMVLPCYEDEILPYFERFGPVYKFHMLIDIANVSCTSGFLTYYLEKSTHAALDVMRYCIRKGTTLGVSKSEESFDVLALNIAPHKSDIAIEKQLASLFSRAESIKVFRQQMDDTGNPQVCTAKMEFPNITKALAAMKIGPLILWGRKVTLEWDKPEKRDHMIANEVSCQVQIRFNDSSFVFCHRSKIF